MAEETQVVVETTQETQVAEPTVVERQAMLDGWVPQSQWAGDPEQWRPAKEFVDRGELIKKIERQGRLLKDQGKAIDDLKDLQAKTREVEYERALNTLRAQKRQALEEGNADNVITIDEQIYQVNRDKDRAKAAEQQAQSSSSEQAPEFIRWKSANSWYESDTSMRSAADAIGDALVAAGNTNPEKVLEEVSKRIKSAFPDKFVNPNRGKQSSVEGSVKSGKSAESYQLTDIERQVMQRFIRTNVFKTEKEYIDSLKNIK